MYTEDSIQRVRDLTAADFIGRYVKLKREGRSWVACCPFHDEKSPSFKIDPAKNIWTCFGSCAESGDLIKFVQKHDSVDFMQAVRILADMAAIDLVEVNDGRTAEDRKAAKDEKQGMYDLMEFACKLYEQELGDEQREALFNRGVTQGDITKWRIGYAPNAWRTLTTLATAQGLLPMAQKLRLVVEKEKGQDTQYFDFYRHRIMLPIMDEQGRVIGFGAWNYAGEEFDGKVVKYINGSDTPLYKKEQVLYGIQHAKAQIIKGKAAGIAEGYFDVISAHRAGIAHMVGTCGTALTDGQLKLLRKWSLEVVELYRDRDSAGEKSSLKNVDMILQNDMLPRMMEWADEHKDIDELIRYAEAIEW